ncbi:MAG: hypothetical protein ACE5DI_00430 [Candidatus Micrarchaeia archaeon]
MQRVRALERIALDEHSLRPTHKLAKAKFEKNLKGTELVAKFDPIQKINESHKELDKRTKIGAVVSIGEFEEALPLKTKLEGKTLVVRIGGQHGSTPTEKEKKIVENVLQQSHTWHSALKEPNYSKRKKLTEKGKQLTKKTSRIVRSTLSLTTLGKKQAGTVFVGINPRRQKKTIVSKNV